MDTFDWSKHTWDVMNRYFDGDPDALVNHQIESFNNLMTDTIPSMLRHKPIEVKHGPRMSRFEILQVYTSKPVQHGTDTGYQPMTPHEARVLDRNYAAPVFIDFKQTFRNGDREFTEIEQKVPLWGQPVLVGSKFCHLYGKTVAERVALNECRYDRGGYFIIKGSEKVVVAQERPVDNKIMLFKTSKTSTSGFEARAEVKSTPDQRFYPIKSCTVFLTKDKQAKKEGSIPGRKLECGIPHIRVPKGRNGIPLFVVFKALGLVPDKTIFEYIIGDTDKAHNEHINMLIPSAQEATEVQTQLDAIRYISNFVNYTPPTGTEETVEEDKLRYTKDILNREYLSHLGQNGLKKAAFLATMVRKLLDAMIDPVLFSDRDHYSNKRVDLVGPLLAQIIRFNLQKLFRNIRVSMAQHITSSPDGVNPDIRSILQKCDLETKVRYALSTGNWHTSRAHANSESKKGTAQVLQRLSFLGTLSHVRRVQSPLETSGSKHEPPRRYHPTQIGKICPNETPEGQKVGVVKNLALTCHVSINASSLPVKYLLQRLGLTDICSAEPRALARSTNVFVNGDLVGIVEDPVKAHKIYLTLKLFKLNGKIGKYTSIAWFKELRELTIQTDGGRYCRPMYVIDRDNRFKMDHWAAWAASQGQTFSQFLESTVNWTDMTQGSVLIDNGDLSFKSGAVIEYLDTNEEECSLLSVFPHQLIPGRTHYLTSGPDGRDQTRATLSYPDSNFSLSESREPAEVHDLIRSKLRQTGYQTLFDQVQVDQVVDEHTVDLSLKAGAPPAAKILLKYLNRFIYSDYRLYTHCELHPAMWHSVVAQMIPFPDHNQSPRNAYQSSMGKQAIGMFATNHRVRVDTMANTMRYPQRPLVQPRTARYTKLDEVPHGAQTIVAVMCHGGYNQEDSVLAHKAAIDRGLFNSLYTRTYTNQLQKHRTANTTQETFGIPPDRKTIDRRVGTDSRDRYQAVDPGTSLPRVGAKVQDDDVLIPKYKKVPGSEAGSVLFSDVSTLVKEGGLVDMVVPNERFQQNENSEGYRFVKAKISVLRKPEIGDKVASRSAQKGTMGMIYRTEDMPFTKDGVIPDIIMNPHAIPSRMTIAQLIECVLGKTALLSGRRRDATPFTEFSLDATKEELSRYGFEHNGNEILYNGQTGEMIKVAIFIGPTYYQRLKHMVADKIHARDLGPVQLMTRQPAEGRSRDGGLRVGEMERDCIIAHGAGQFLKEKQNESSDLFQVFVSRERGDIVATNPQTGVYKRGETDIYEHEDVRALNLPFAMNLLMREAHSILVSTKLKVDKKTK